MTEAHRPPIEPQDPESLAPEPKGQDPKGPESKVAPEPQDPKSKAKEPQDPEPKAPESKAKEPKDQEPKAKEPKDQESKAQDASPKEPKSKKPRSKDPLAKNQEKKDFWRLMGLIRPYRPKLLLAILFMLLAAGSTATMAWLIQPLLDHVFTNRDASLLNSLTILTLSVYTLTGIFSFAQSYAMNQVGYNIVNDLRVELYARIQGQSLGYFQAHHSGELVSRVVNDVALIQSSVTTVVTGLIMDLGKVAGLITVLFLQDSLLASVGILILPLTLYPIIKFGRRLRSLSTKSQIIMASLIRVLTETFQGVRMIQSYNMTGHEIKRFAGECRKNVENLMRSVTVKSLSSSIMEIVGGFCLAAVIWYGGYAVINGTSTPGAFFSFMTALLLLYEPLKRLTRLNNEFQQGLAAARRIFEALDAKPTIVSPSQPIIPEKALGRLDFEDVTFGYDPDRPVLKDLNLTVKVGETVALVGPSGGGKTSLVNLAPRFHDPQAGRVLLDGHDLRDLDLAWLRAQIALVSQEITLLDEAARHNIAYGRLNASFEEVKAAALAAKALDFVTALPNGFETNVGEGGHSLSGGQRQRLAIARAILKNSPILILDEATSALDTESEKIVQAALDNLMRDRTTLVVAHRLSTVVKADRIVFIKDGRIAESGDHQSLMAQKGEYYRLYNLQFAVQALTADQESDPAKGSL
ncbi:MAG: ATP-binding cassette domain-containing protein [Deltaproteobacteria bacterium]|jgi:subfamily B ATP-binding cassette protein MsbA|nr:ATP-binding cassette domain-containing protein [Deltaproteobacteria bacterium]